MSREKYTESAFIKTVYLKNNEWFDSKQSSVFPLHKQKEDTKVICPICNREFYERPAISRRNRKTNICPKCGIREALEDVPDSSIPPEEKQEMFNSITSIKRLISIGELSEQAARAIEENLSGTVTTTTSIKNGLYGITIRDKSYNLSNTIYIDAFYEVYTKTQDLSKAIHDIVVAAEHNITTAREILDRI
ncbi:MAG: hypothetical protein NC548_47755 [Lachnospiraceae bacterium]|nr:hypothetical protein [Lachnospiraceae bacterium]